MPFPDMSHIEACRRSSPSVRWQASALYLSSPPVGQAEAMVRDLICQAIYSRRLLRFSYAGELRTVEPHALGYDREGDTVLSAWQVSGGPAGWRTFAVSKMLAIGMSDRSFPSARPGYNRADPGVGDVICQM